MKSYKGLLSPKGLRIKTLIVEGSNCNIIHSNFSRATASVGVLQKCSNIEQNKKEKDNLKNGKNFQRP